MNISVRITRGCNDHDDNYDYDDFDKMAKNMTTNTLAGLTTWTVSLGIAEQSARPELREDTSLANPISITQLGKS